MQEKRTNRHKAIVSLMVTLTSITAALLTFIADSKTIPEEINIKSKTENQPLLADSLALKIYSSPKGINTFSSDNI